MNATPRLSIKILLTIILLLNFSVFSAPGFCTERIITPLTPTLKSHKPSMGLNRDELFLRVFNHPPPDIPVNTFVMLMVQNRSSGRIKVDFQKGRENVLLQGNKLIRSLSPILNPTSLEQLKSQIDDNDWLEKKILIAQGIEAKLDLSTFRFFIDVPTPLMKTQEHNMGHTMIDPYSVDYISPNLVSGFLNTSSKGVFLHTGDSAFNNIPDQFISVGVDGALCLKGIVFEGTGVYDNQNSFDRGDLRFVYDRPRKMLRYSAGDLSVESTGFQESLNIGGIGLTTDFSLQPHLQAKRTGNFEFQLERPANVKVWVNGSLVKTLILQAGSHDIRGLSPDIGQNDVQLVIEDATGQKQRLHFSFFYSSDVLDPGQQEFFLNTGFLRKKEDGNYQYNTEEPLLSVSYRRGVSERITLGSYSQISKDYSLLGVEGVHAFPVLNLDFDIAIQNNENNETSEAFKLILSRMGNSQSSSSLTWQGQLEYQGENFGHESGSQAFLQVISAIAFPLVGQWNGRLSGSYTRQYGDKDSNLDTYATSAGIQKRWGRYLSTDVRLTYERDEKGKEDTRLLAGITFNFGLGNHAIYATRELEGAVQASWAYETPGNISKSRASTSIRHDSDRTESEAGLGYGSNLGSIDVNHIRNFIKKEETSSQLARTEVVVQSALAFAGSSFALSRPIRNNFVIVKGQRGLKETDLVINPDGSGNYVAKTTNFSPAIHPNLSPYRLSNIRVEPANPPIGATPRKTTFTLFPSYKSGTLLSLGQDIQILAIGRMVDSKHQPIANKSFEIKPTGNDGGKSIRIFTSRTGRFQIGGIQPGLYRILPSSKDNFKAKDLKISKTTKDFVQLGNIVLDEIK